jgi:transcriptional regulator with XRE-family HTH domain
MNERPEDLGTALGRRIRELRQAQNLSQEEVAERVGVSQPTWSRLERTGDLTVRQLVRFQALVGVETLESFLGDLPSQAAGRGERDGS